MQNICCSLRSNAVETVTFETDSDTSSKISRPGLEISKFVDFAEIFQ